MGRGRRSHNRNSRKHTNYQTTAAGFDQRQSVEHDLREALPEAPAALIGEVARAATLSQDEAKRLLTSGARRVDALDAQDVQRGRKVLDHYATYSA